MVLNECCTDRFVKLVELSPCSPSPILSLIIKRMIEITPLPVPFIRSPRKFAAVAFNILLIAIIALGIFYRFNWVNWNQDTDLHPDEYGLTGTLTQLSMPKNLDEYFNTRLSPISPYQKYDENGAPTQVESSRLALTIGVSASPR